ncbi:ovochymase-1 [Gallus gallus]|uniref:ovochymase-1 n=1 Tax=Gallus gallus TaxID=9031 RepID=UPI001AE87B39|nr:ovochymase-1 [Gallus gallus]
MDAALPVGRAAVQGPLPLLELCSPQGTLIFGESGHVQENSYPDNSPCMWNITVPEEKMILIYFTKLDAEYHVGCDCDFVSLYSSRRELISSGCGSVATQVEKGKIDTANCPGLYPRNKKCHWLIEAPAEYAVKLEFDDFAVELSAGCIYSSVAVYTDEEDENQLANLCGFSAPTPVLGPGNTMLVHFGSDGEMERTASEDSEPSSLLFIQVSREMPAMSNNVCTICIYS